MLPSTSNPAIAPQAQAPNPFLPFQSAGAGSPGFDARVNSIGGGPQGPTDIGGNNPANPATLQPPSTFGPNAQATQDSFGGQMPVSGMNGGGAGFGAGLWGAPTDRYASLDPYRRRRGVPQAPGAGY